MKKGLKEEKGTLKDAINMQAISWVSLIPEDEKEDFNDSDRISIHLDDLLLRYEVFSNGKYRAENGIEYFSDLDELESECCDLLERLGTIYYI